MPMMWVSQAAATRIRMLALDEGRTMAMVVDRLAGVQRNGATTVAVMTSAASPTPVAVVDCRCGHLRSQHPDDGKCLGRGCSCRGYAGAK